MIPALLTSTSMRPNAVDRGRDEGLGAVDRRHVAACRRPPCRPAATISATASAAGPASAPSPSIEPPRSLTTTAAPRVGEQAGVRPADAASRAGDDRDPPVEAVLVHLHPGRVRGFVPTSHPTLGLRPPPGSPGVRSPLCRRRPRRRHHAQPTRGPQRGRTARWRSALEAAVDRARGRSRRAGSASCAPTPRARPARCSAPAPTSRWSRRPDRRHARHRARRASPGSCSASARSRSSSRSTASRPRAGSRSCSPRDIVVATTRSSFGLAEVRRNLIAAAGGLFRLPRAIGRAVGDGRDPHRGADRRPARRTTSGS